MPPAPTQLLESFVSQALGTSYLLSADLYQGVYARITAFDEDNHYESGGLHDQDHRSSPCLAQLPLGAEQFLFGPAPPPSPPVQSTPGAPPSFATNGIKQTDRRRLLLSLKICELPWGSESSSSRTKGAPLNDDDAEFRPEKD